MDFVNLVPSFGNALYTIGAFVVALGAIVAVHEFGHYAVGRWCGIKAEVFSLGFGPALWSRVDRRGTRWQVAAVPLGGFVRFREGAPDGSLDGSLDGAPLGARALTVAAGPVANFVLSILVFGALLMWSGSAADPLTVDEVRALPDRESVLREGDEILAIGGATVPAAGAALPAAGGALAVFLESLPHDPVLEYRLRRNGEVLAVDAPHPLPAVIGSVVPGSAAADAGLRAGDVVAAIGGEPVHIFADLRDRVGASGGAEVEMDIRRGGERVVVALAPRETDIPALDGSFETRFVIGVGPGPLFTPRTEALGPGEALLGAVDQTLFVVRSSLSGLYHVAVGAISSCNLRGPVGIAQTSGAAASQGLSAFVWFVAVLSTAIGLVNLFPIPVLDGGHLVFFAYEAVAGRPPGARTHNVLVIVGIALLALLMAFALSNDFLCP